MSSLEPRNTISDPLLAAAMAELRRERTDVDWERMQRSINERATAGLARRGPRRFSGFVKSFIPIATAAGVAFTLWLGPSLFQQAFYSSSNTTFVSNLDPDEILREAIDGDLSEQDFRLLITGRTTPEELLSLAIAEP